MLTLRSIDLFWWKRSVNPTRSVILGSKYFHILFIILGLSYLVAGRNTIKKIIPSVIRRLSYQKCNPKIVNNAEECLSAVFELRNKCRSVRVLGLDCEWLANNKGSKVALLQLASVDGYCSLFRLCSIGHVPQCLHDLLSDKSIMKAGVAVTNDARRLLKDYGVQCMGCIDVRYMAKHVGLTALGLGKMSELYLGFELDKSWKIRCSDWEAEELSNQQITYAAQDAFMSALLFEFFNNRQMKHFPWWKRIFWTNRHKWHTTEQFWNKYTDKGFSEKSNTWYQQKRTILKSENRNDILSPKHVNRTRLSSPSTIKQYSTSINTARKTPLYHNIFLQAPDGEVLCTCDNKKADWYLNKGIAHIICEDPITLRLSFEPSGRKGGGEGYYARAKNNVCVVCASTKLMRRKNIVPHEYRKYFPVEVKDHSSHDVLLLCDYCHCKSQYYDQQLRYMLAEQCNAPISNSDENAKVFEVAELKHVRSAARALLKSKHRIPEYRKKELEFLLFNYLEHSCKKNSDNDIVITVEKDTDNTQIFDDELLERLSNINTSIKNEEYQPHGLKVVEFYKSKYDKEEDGIYSLEQLWRSHFVKCMSPKYLPDLWSVTYTHTRRE